MEQSFDKQLDVVIVKLIIEINTEMNIEEALFNWFTDWVSTDH